MGWMAAAKERKRARNVVTSGPTIPHAERRGRRIEVYLPDEMGDALEDACAELGVTRAEAVRLAVAGWLAGFCTDGRAGGRSGGKR